MCPYLSKQAYERLVSEERDSASTTVADFVPKKDDMLLLTAFKTQQKPYFVVKVVDYDPDNQFVTFHYYNTSSKHAHLGHKPVYVHKNKPEIHELRRPPSIASGYKPDIQSAPIDHFCPYVLDGVHARTQYNLTPARVKKALSHVQQKTN